MIGVFKRVHKPQLLATAIVASLAAGVIGSFATTTKIGSWYAELDKPLFNPPNWIFGPVWTTLYIMMGISLYLVWISRSDESKKSAFITYGVQLALNTIWSLVFFGLEQPWAAFVVILLLIASILLTMREFAKFNEISVYLLMPYLGWVAFATYLNLGIALLNT